MTARPQTGGSHDFKDFTVPNRTAAVTWNPDQILFTTAQQANHDQGSKRNAHQFHEFSIFIEIKARNNFTEKKYVLLHCF